MHTNYFLFSLLLTPTTFAEMRFVLFLNFEYRDMDRTLINGLKILSQENGTTILKTSSELIDELRKVLDKLEEKIHSTSDVPVQALIIDGKALDIVFHRDDPYSINVQKMYVENPKVENVVNCNLY